MCKVKAQPVFVDTGSCLLYMSAENRAESFLQKMGRTVVSRRKSALPCIYFKRHFVIHFDHALCHNAYMTDLSSKKLDRIFHSEFPFRSSDVSGISFLSAACRIERSLIYKHS